MVHLSKLAVGITDATHLSTVQQQRLAQSGVVVHWTRSGPRRAAELIDGGSLFWIIAGTMRLRQRVLAIEPAQRPDGTPCVALRLDPRLVAVAHRAMRPFQGWRYLEQADAPPDLATLAGAHGEDQLPAALRQTLQALALL